MLRRHHTQRPQLLVQHMRALLPLNPQVLLDLYQRGKIDMEFPLEIHGFALLL